jgi:hypothetical protein
MTEVISVLEGAEVVSGVADDVDEGVEDVEATLDEVVLVGVDVVVSWEEVEEIEVGLVVVSDEDVVATRDEMELLVSEVDDESTAEAEVGLELAELDEAAESEEEVEAAEAAGACVDDAESLETVLVELLDMMKRPRMSFPETVERAMSVGGDESFLRRKRRHELGELRAIRHTSDSSNDLSVLRPRSGKGKVGRWGGGREVVEAGASEALVTQKC